MKSFPPFLLVVLWLGLLSGAGSGCRKPAESEPSPAAGKAGQAAPTTTVAAGKIKVKDGAGAVAFSLKPKADGGKLVGPDEAEMARFNRNGDKLKVKTATDEVIGYVVGAGDRFKVTGPDQAEVRFKLIRQADGDWKLEDGKDTLLLRIKKRDYGFEIEDAGDRSLSKTKLKEGKTSLRDAADRTLFSTTDAVRPEAFACLGLDRIEDLRMRVALLEVLNTAPPLN